VTTIRKAIRHYLRDRIRDLVPELGGRVWTNRGPALEPEEMPCCVVWSTTMESTPLDEAPLAYSNACTIIVQVYVTEGAKADDGIDDRLDDMVELVANVLKREDTLQGCVSSLRLQRTDRSAEYKDAVFGEERLTYTVTYQDPHPGSREEDLRPLRVIAAKWDGAPDADGTVDFEDEVHLPGPR